MEHQWNPTCPNPLYPVNPMTATITCMAAKASTDRHKPGRMVRVPESLAVILDELAAEQLNSLTEQVKICIRERLTALGRWPAPPKKSPKAPGRDSST